MRASNCAAPFLRVLWMGTFFGEAAGWVGEKERENGRLPKQRVGFSSTRRDFALPFLKTRYLILPLYLPVFLSLDSAYEKKL